MEDLKIEKLINCKECINKFNNKLKEINNKIEVFIEKDKNLCPISMQHDLLELVETLKIAKVPELKDNRIIISGENSTYIENTGNLNFDL